MYIKFESSSLDSSWENTDKKFNVKNMEWKKNEFK